jgi:hypothetical protein
LAGETEHRSLYASIVRRLRAAPMMRPWLAGLTLLLLGLALVIVAIALGG